MILHVEKALEHARWLVLEVLGNANGVSGGSSGMGGSGSSSSLAQVTMSNMLALSNYAQLVFALDELIHDTNWHHVPKRGMEWVSGVVAASMSGDMGKFLHMGGRHLVMGSLLGNQNSGVTSDSYETRRHATMKRRATKIRLEDTEVLHMGMNWQKESKMLRVMDERFKQLRDFALDTGHDDEVHAGDHDLYGDCNHDSTANLMSELQFDDTWKVPDMESAGLDNGVGNLQVSHHILKHQKSFDTSMNAHFGITSHQFDRLTKTSLDQLDQNAITSDMNELDMYEMQVGNVSTTQMLTPPVASGTTAGSAAGLDSLYSYERRRFSNPSINNSATTPNSATTSGGQGGVAAARNLPSSTLVSPPRQQSQRDSTKLDNFDLLRLDGTNTTVGSETQTFSDTEDDSSTVDSFRLSSSSMSGMLSSGVTSQSMHQQQSPHKPHLPTSPQQASDALPLIMNINETITSTSNGSTLQAHQVFGEISVGPSEAYQSSGAENVRFSVIFPSNLLEGSVDQFLPNTKVCRPAKNKRLTYNCSIPDAVLSKGKNIPLLRYKMSPSFQPMPLKIMVRRQVTKNISRIMVDYALNPKLRPNVISLMIDPMPENSSVRVQKVQFKPQEMGKWNAESQQLLFKIRIEDDNVKTGKIMAQFLCDQDLESISEELESKPLLMKYLLKSRSFLAQDAARIQVKPLGSDRTCPLPNILTLSEMIQGNAKV